MQTEDPHASGQSTEHAGQAVFDDGALCRCAAQCLGGVQKEAGFGLETADFRCTEHAVLQPAVQTGEAQRQGRLFPRAIRGHGKREGETRQQCAGPLDFAQILAKTLGHGRPQLAQKLNLIQRRTALGQERGDHRDAAVHGNAAKTLDGFFVAPVQAELTRHPVQHLQAGLFAVDQRTVQIKEQGGDGGGRGHGAHYPRRRMAARGCLAAHKSYCFAGIG